VFILDQFLPAPRRGKRGRERLTWGIGDPMVPVHLLIYAVQTGVTTLTCVMDYVSWDVPMKVKVDLGGLYGPYLALCKLFTDVGLGWVADEV
jgi:hypothetical protein